VSLAAAVPNALYVEHIPSCAPSRRGKSEQRPDTPCLRRIQASASRGIAGQWKRCASSDYLRDSGGFDIGFHLAQHPGITLAQLLRTTVRRCRCSRARSQTLRERSPVAYGHVAVRLQYEDPNEMSDDRHFIGYLQVFLWLPEKDSNLH
jgi:hypothetical protein